jgi:hypothetical protein
MQMDLEFRLGIRIRLVDGIAREVPRCGNQALSFSARDGQCGTFFE